MKAPKTKKALERIDYKKGETFKHEKLGSLAIIKVWPLGTVDVVTKTGKVFRITGLPIYK